MSHVHLVSFKNRVFPYIPRVVRLVALQILSLYFIVFLPLFCLCSGVWFQFSYPELLDLLVHTGCLDDSGWVREVLGFASYGTDIVNPRALSEASRAVMEVVAERLPDPDASDFVAEHIVNPSPYSTPLLLGGLVVAFILLSDN